MSVGSAREGDGLGECWRRVRVGWAAAFGVCVFLSWEEEQEEEEDVWMDWS